MCSFRGVGITVWIERGSMFLSIDGIDGAGKTTQLSLFHDWLRDRGHQVVACRDPGTTPLGEEIRKILLTVGDLPIHGRSEMLLYMAARSQLVEQIIRPALAAGQTVVADRYLLANVVYQGHAGGLDVDSVWQVGEVATGGLMPDVTIVLDIDPESARSRFDRDLDRIEQRGDEFRNRLRQGFLAEARRRPDQIVVVNAARSIEEIQDEIRAVALSRDA